MTRADLGIVQTSQGCVRYALFVGETCIWANRVAPTKAGRAGAVARMTAWATAHDVEIDEGFYAETPDEHPAQVIIPGRYGKQRH